VNWDTRRLSLAIENAALCLAAAALVITGYWIIALVAVIVKLIDNCFFIRDWMAHGQPRTSWEASTDEQVER
jgi:hypothetical protein